MASVPAPEDVEAVGLGAPGPPVVGAAGQKAAGLELEPAGLWPGSLGPLSLEESYTFFLGGGSLQPYVALCRTEEQPLEIEKLPL